MLKVVNLSKSYGSNVLFDEVTFSINRGERVGLVGRNGHGKTTLLRLVTGEESPDSGSLAIPRGYRIGHLAQTLQFSQPTALMEAAQGLQHSERDDLWKAEKVLAGLGFSSGDQGRSPLEFSGGFQVRLNLARLLVSRPDLLLLDEPTNYLDIIAIRWLERFFKAWSGEMLLITHDRGFMDKVTTHTMGIHRRKFRKIPGDTVKYYCQIATEEEIFEKSRVNLEKKRRHTEEFIRKFRAKARLGGLVQSRIKTLEKLGVSQKLDQIRSLHFSFRSMPFRSRVMLDVSGLSFCYPGQQIELMEDLNVVVGQGDRIGVIGANGKGKSTLLRLLAGELSPGRGEVKSHPRLKVGYYGQTNVERLLPERSVVEEIRSSDPDGSLQKAMSICGRMMFVSDDASKRISVLSGGEKCRVLLGKLLLDPVHLLLLDEPTNHLDMESGEALFDALGRFDGALVMVTHNERFLDAFANRLIVFDNGAVSVFEGTYKQFIREMGWRAEEPVEGHKGQRKKDRVSRSTRSKAARKERADAIRERSRTLRPLEAKADELEKTIAVLERSLRENEEALVNASTAGTVERIPELSRQNHGLSADIERHYELLCLATEDLETTRRKWENEK
ncbi:MAG TPA: ABC-F family ATP-binding cassette domain-containing protein [Proteobacteria bacterium]|nr:ABC-F family ATP-binding cassette domain-containing protein [Pseudomonadota bacterium]